ncbi:putative rhamnosyl transferase [Hasllibacter sp. MH4015]|uniref:putative rhamnosyl transferase n=1 Tax=Hasllibacter sp. MH4015 TaxID=2854029 RepID=UPI001CD73E86|nr:putative rhamnosyl transferase [Hasllibacter sp. MH4015]
MPEGVQIQGLCRFSLPCTGGFKKYHESLEDRRAALYAPKRLDERTLWFEYVFLPPLRAQTDADFTMHLVLGEDFPDPWRSRVEAAIRDVPQIKAHWRAPDDHRAICRDVLWGGRDATRAVVAEFRLDDDDAVAIDYVQQLRRSWNKVGRLANFHGRVALDHGKGVVLEAQQDGTIKPHVFNTQCWSAGLAIYLRPEDEAIVMDFPHHKIWSRVPFVNLTDSVMFIRGDHDHNDARTPFAAALPVPVPDGDIADVIQRRFAIDFPAFRADWQALVRG